MLPPGAENVILNSLVIHHRKRIQTAEFFADCLEGKKKVSKVAAQKKKKGITAFRVGMAAAVFCAVCIGGAFIIRSQFSKEGLDNAVSANEKEIRIPNLEGKDTEKELKALGLKLEVVEVNYSETIPRGQITGQEPERGEKAGSGDTVKVVRSGGTQEIMIKNLVGTTREETEKWIKNQNLAGQVEWLDDAQNDELYSEEQEEGTILSQSLEAKSLYTLGSGSLKLSVCQGSLGEKTDEIAVPDLTGKTLAEAKDILSQSPGEQGYTFTLTDEAEMKEEFSWDYDPGQIISQEPKAGNTARTNKRIRLTVARELRQAEVPDVYEMSPTEAEQTLEAAHFRVSLDGQYSDNYPKGKIYGVSAEGEEINPDGTKTFLEKTTIIVTYSNGPKPEPETESKRPTGGGGDYNPGGTGGGIGPSEPTVVDNIS